MPAAPASFCPQGYTALPLPVELSQQPPSPPSVGWAIQTLRLMTPQDGRQAPIRPRKIVMGISPGVGTFKLQVSPGACSVLKGLKSQQAPKQT
jgi:hypothetical protein